MDIKNAHENYLREEIYMAAAAGDLDRLVLLLEDMEDLCTGELTEETPEVAAPVRREAPAPTAGEQAAGVVLTTLAVAFTVLLFLALCAAPDHW